MNDLSPTRRVCARPGWPTQGHQAETYSDPDDEVIRSAKSVGRHAAFGTKLGPGYYPRLRLRELLEE